MRAHWLWISALLVAFAPTMRWLFERWTLSVWHNVHGLFVPVAVGVCAWRILKRHEGAGQPSALGFLFVLPAVALVIADCALRTDLLSAIALVICLPGLSLLLFGVAMTRKLGFPLVLAAFMLPIPMAAVESLQVGLRAVSASGAEQVMRLLGFTLSREGTTLFLPTGALFIGNACSGFSTLYASVALGAVMGYLSPSWRRRAGIAAAALVFPVVANMLRCAALGMAVSSSGLEVLDAPFHVMSGVVAFVFVAVMLVAVGGGRRVVHD